MRIRSRHSDILSPGPPDQKSVVTYGCITPEWTPRQRAVITIADSIVDRRALTDDEDALVRESLTDAERIEFLAVASLYLGIAALCAALEIPAEPGAPAMPSV